MSKDPAPGFAQKPQSMNGWNYVYGNPVKLTDPSGKFPPFPPPPGHVFGPSSQPEEDVCASSWPKSGYFRDLCDQAYQHGDLDAMETIYRYIANIEAGTNLQKASEALHHFLDGTSTPGDPFYVSWSWYLTAPETKTRYFDLRKKIDNYIDTLKQDCRCHVPGENPVRRSSDAINIDPYPGGVPHDIQATVGAHNLHVEANLNLNSDCIGTIRYEWYVYEYFDFRKGAGNIFHVPFLKWQVPTAWLDFLVDNSRAAEYWVAIQHAEEKLYSNHK